MFDHWKNQEHLAQWLFKVNKGRELAKYFGNNSFTNKTKMSQLYIATPQGKQLKGEEAMQYIATVIAGKNERETIYRWYWSIKGRQSN